MLHLALFRAGGLVRPILASALLALSFSSATPVLAKEMITVTDIAGRTVTLKHGAERVILGTGRMLYSVAILDKEKPFQRIIGWNANLVKTEPDAFRKYEEKYATEMAAIADLGSPYSADFSIEKAISLNADLVIFNLGDLFRSEESGVLTKLSKAGIPVIFIDHRLRPLQNSVPTMLLLGRVFAKEGAAQEYVDFYMKEIRKVTNITSGIVADDRPLVFVERAAGIQGPNDCCRTFGGANFGKFVDEAGGVNWGTKLFPGFASEVSFEAMIAVDPAAIVGTGASWGESRPEAYSISLGYDSTPEKVQEQLLRLSLRSGFQNLSAVKTKRFFTIHHQFYNSPYHVAAIQRLAKWFQPEEFADLDPEATFKEIHDRFLPIDASGVFWGELQ